MNHENNLSMKHHLHKKENIQIDKNTDTIITFPKISLDKNLGNKRCVSVKMFPIQFGIDQTKLVNPLLQKPNVVE